MFHVSPAPVVTFVRPAPVTLQLCGCPTFIYRALTTSSVLINTATRYTVGMCILQFSGNISGMLCCKLQLLGFSFVCILYYDILLLYSFFSRFRSTAILYFINFPFHNITVLNADITFPPGSRCRPLPLWRTWHPQPLPPCHAVPLPLLLGQDNYRPVSDIWRGSKSVCVWRM